MEAPPNPTPKKERDQTYKKTTEKNENYSLNIKIKDNDSIYLSIIFEGENQTYEDIKSFEEIKKQQAYFEDYTLEEIFDEISDLISKNNYEFNKNHEEILINVILPSKKKKTVDFVLGIKKAENIGNSIFQQVIKQKDDIINNLKEIIKQKDEIIKEKNNIIKSQENINNKNKDQKDSIELEEKKEITEGKEEEVNQNNNKKIDYNKIFQDFNIANKTPKYRLTNHGNNCINTILQLQDGRLASGGNDGSIIIYKPKTFEPEMTIKAHSKSIYDIIQLKNGNLLSCSYDDKTMNEYIINENNTYKLISQVNVGKDNIPIQIHELENGEIGLVAYNSIIFYLNLNNKLDVDFIIKSDDNQIGKYYEMISAKPGELVIAGEKDKIQFFDINSRKLKEIININRDIRWTGNLLCMMNERCLCVGGANKITIIDVYNKNIIREIQETGTHRCLFKVNDNILLTGKDGGDITQWKINENNLTLICKKEKAHQSSIRDIIKFNDLIISCSSDNSIKVW